MNASADRTAYLKAFASLSGRLLDYLEGPMEKERGVAVRRPLSMSAEREAKLRDWRSSRYFPVGEVWAELDAERAAHDAALSKLDAARDDYFYLRDKYDAMRGRFAKVEKET